MINKKLIIILLLSIIIILLITFIVLDVSYFKLYKKLRFIETSLNKNNYAKTNLIKHIKEDLTQNNKDENIIDNEDQKNKSSEENLKNDIEKEKNNIAEKKDTHKKTAVNNLNKNNKIQDEKKLYAKGSDLPDQNFHSFGEYISLEEEKYRNTLISNLKIKTVVIDKLTKGNGITQEFYKVAYINKMIPAKILDNIVESKEFRDLIPNKFLNNEIRINGLKKGEKVVFKNTDIKNILILWKLGRLTPIQKAWIVKAEK